MNKCKQRSRRETGKVRMMNHRLSGWVVRTGCCLGWTTEWKVMQQHRTSDHPLENVSSLFYQSFPYPAYSSRCDMIVVKWWSDTPVHTHSCSYAQMAFGESLRGFVDSGQSMTGIKGLVLVKYCWYSRKHKAELKKWLICEVKEWAEASYRVTFVCKFCQWDSRSEL